MSGNLSTLKQLLGQIGNDYFYIMHLSYGEGRESYREPLWEYGRKNALIGLDYDDKPDVNQRWEEFPENRKRHLSRAWRNQFELFSRLRKDDCIVVAEGQNHFLGVGLVDSRYKFRPELESDFFRHVRKIRWLLAYEWDKRLPMQFLGFRNTIKKIDEDSPYWPITDKKLNFQKNIPIDVRPSPAGKKGWQVRKYGPSGEGEEHKKLKKWVLDHPQEVGLNQVIRKETEYEFQTGDRADILFELPKGRFAVIEIETDNPQPGVLQALKYKVLKCAEIGIDIKSKMVEAILVAWKEPEDMELCQKYAVHFVIKRL